MKTDFKSLWPWFTFNSHVEDMTWWTIGFPTRIDFTKHKPSGEWHFEIQVLGLGFCIERYPVKTRGNRRD